MAVLTVPAIVLDAGIFAACPPALVPYTSATLPELAVDKNTTGETPHPYARVAVFRLLDIKKVWEGYADAEGRWHADGLQPGLDYVALGIDTRRVYKATAAGPVRATDTVGAPIIAPDAGDGQG